MATFEPGVQVNSSVALLLAGFSWYLSWAFGIWDGDCPYQSYLTMYSVSEKARFRSQPVRWQTLDCTMRAVGLAETQCVKFMCIPDRFIHDLGINAAAPEDISRILDVDLAVRARFPDAAGQMFLASAVKADDRVAAEELSRI